MINKLKNEPSVVVSALVAVVGAAATLGLIGTDQQAQIVAVITALVPIVGGLIVRANVTPTRKVAPLSVGDVTVKLKPVVDSASVTPDVTDAAPAAKPAPAEPAPAPAPMVSEDPVKVAMKTAIENVRVTSNNTNDARAAAAVAAVDASA